jgi:hypothetical protein
MLLAARSAAACRWRTPSACTARPRELAAVAGSSRLRQMQGLPSEAFDMLARTLARICDDPYDPVFSAPVPPVPGRRVADLGDFDFIEFIADEEKGLVRVYHLVWTG